MSTNRLFVQIDFGDAKKEGDDELDEPKQPQDDDEVETGDKDGEPGEDGDGDGQAAFAEEMMNSIS